MPEQSVEQYRLDRLEEDVKDVLRRVDALEKRASRVFEMYDSQKEDAVQVGRTIKAALYTTLGSAVVFGVVIPIMQRFFH